MKRLLLLFVCFFFGFIAMGQEVETHQFKEIDGQKLYLDVYSPALIHDSMPCVIYIFGGGFVTGERNDDYAQNYCNMLAKKGFVVVPVDYRLGMKGAKKVGALNYKPVETAVYMATEDIVSAIAYLLKNADQFHIDPTKIILVGSSAGAVTALETDYFICNGRAASVLPADFRLGGVVSYSGAIFSHEGKVKYRNQSPAPTMMFHGTIDKMVTYKQIKLGRVGFFGADKITKRFVKYGYPFYIRRYEGYAHGVAKFCDKTIDEFLWFYKNYVEEGRRLQVDENFLDLDGNRPANDDLRPDQFYK